MHLKEVEHENALAEVTQALTGARRTEGGPRRNHFRDWNVGSSGKASAKVSFVGDADKGRMVESVLARLWRGEDGVERSVSS